MAKIDLEKLICSLAERKYFSEEKLQGALKEQGLEYKDGEIVESQKTKFKVGDWVVDEQGNCFIINSIERGFYFAQLSGCCYQTPIDIDLVDNSYHTWTLEDAKDGDMLVCENGLTCIFMGLCISEKVFASHCFIDTDGCFCSVGGLNHTTNPKICGEISPAENFQRYRFFQKMKEAGYEWDAEKKELKPIDNRFDYEHANIQQKDFAPKAVTAHRQVYNRAILKILSNYVEKYHDTRFGQMLCNLDVNPHFDEESRETYWNLCKTINKQNHE